MNISRTGDQSSALSVRYAVGGTATPGTDYQVLTGTVTIQPGNASANVVVSPINDGFDELDESVTISILPESSYSTSTPLQATVQILDDDVTLPSIPTISMTTSTTTISEGSGGVDVRFSRDSNFGSPLTIHYALGGSANAGTDFATLTGSVTLGAGQSSTFVQILPIDDSIAEGAETVEVSVQANNAYTVGSPSQTTITILDNDFEVEPPAFRPEVSIQTDSSLVVEGQGGTAMRVSRTGSTSSPLTVTYSVSGDATNGADFTSLPGLVTIPAGASSTTIQVDPIDDVIGEDIEFAYVLVTPNIAYTIGSPETSFAILDNDDSSAEGEPNPQPGPSLAQVSVTSDASTTSEGSSGVNLRFTRTGNVNSPLTVGYNVGGSAIPNSDYNRLSGQVSFSAGSTSAVVRVTPVDDTLTESDETIVVSLSSSPNYAIGPNGQTTVRIVDNDAVVEPPPSLLPGVSVTTGSLSVPEGAGSFPMRFQRVGDISSSLTVHYQIDGTATLGVDFSRLTGSIVIASGTISRTVNVVLVDDALVESNESIRVTILPNPAYSIDSPATTAVQIIDDDGPTFGASDEFQFAFAEDSRQGFVSDGDLSRTTSSDDQYEVLQDSAENSRLIHVWEIQVPSYETATVVLEAHRSVGDEAIRVDYSIDGYYFRNLFTITKTSDDDQSLTRELPSGLDGTIYLRVRDSARLGGVGSINVFVDYLAIRVTGASGGSAASIPVAAVAAAFSGDTTEQFESNLESSRNEIGTQLAIPDFRDDRGWDAADLVQSSFATETDWISNHDALALRLEEMLARAAD